MDGYRRRRGVLQQAQSVGITFAARGGMVPGAQFQVVGPAVRQGETQVGVLHLVGHLVVVLGQLRDAVLRQQEQVRVEMRTSPRSHGVHVHADFLPRLPLEGEEIQVAGRADVPGETLPEVQGRGRGGRIVGGALGAGVGLGGQDAQVVNRPGRGGIVSPVQGDVVEAQAYRVAHIRGQRNLRAVQPAQHGVVLQLQEILKGAAIHRDLHPPLVPVRPVPLRVGAVPEAQGVSGQGHGNRRRGQVGNERLGGARQSRADHPGVPVARRVGAPGPILGHPRGAGFHPRGVGQRDGGGDGRLRAQGEGVGRAPLGQGDAAGEGRAGAHLPGVGRRGKRQRQGGGGLPGGGQRAGERVGEPRLELDAPAAVLPVEIDRAGQDAARERPAEERQGGRAPFGKDAHRLDGIAPHGIVGQIRVFRREGGAAPREVFPAKERCQHPLTQPEGGRIAPSNRPQVCPVSIVAGVEQGAVAAVVRLGKEGHLPGGGLTGGGRGRTGVVLEDLPQAGEGRAGVVRSILYAQRQRDGAVGDARGAQIPGVGEGQRVAEDRPDARPRAGVIRHELGAGNAAQVVGCPAFQGQRAGGDGRVVYEGGQQTALRRGVVGVVNYVAGGVVSLTVLAGAGGLGGSARPAAVDAHVVEGDIHGGIPPVRGHVYLEVEVMPGAAAGIVGHPQVLPLLDVYAVRA